MNKIGKFDLTIGKIIFIVMVLAVILLSAGFYKSINDSKKEPDFCITVDPEFMLSCEDQENPNMPKIAISNQENLNIALEKNNCSVIGENHILDIIYCNQETNLSKYRILTGSKLN